MMTSLRGLIPLLITLFISACSSIPDYSHDVNLQQHQANLEQIHSSRTAGRLAYISPDKKQNLNFQWEHGEDESHLKLTTFIGQTVLDLVVNSTGATIDIQGEKHSDDDAALLIHKFTGLVIPMENLQEWLKGTPLNADSYLFNSHNTLASLWYQDWKLEYRSYGPVLFDNDNDDMTPSIPLSMPNQLNLKQGDVSLQISISQWTLVAG